MTTEQVCLNPFTWCEIHGDGSVFCCCPAWIGRPLGNLLRQPFAAIWNGDRARAIRAAVLDGSFRHCNRRRCPRLATGQAPVLARSAVSDPQLAAVLAAGTTRLPFGPRHLNACFDRSCNLACPSCRSSPYQAAGDDLARVRQIQERLLAELGPGLESLSLSGTGDPFASPVQRPFLEDFPAARLPRLRRIHLHSNGQLWDRQAWSRLGGIHHLVHSAEISVDAATAATYAENRGADWRRLRANLAFIAGLGLELRLSCVVQANNFRELPGFLELAASVGATAYCSQLVDWRSFARREYLARAVHLPGHPQHPELRRVLAALPREPGLDLGNLEPLRAPA